MAWFQFSTLFSKVDLLLVDPRISPGMIDWLRPPACSFKCAVSKGVSVMCTALGVYTYITANVESRLYCSPHLMYIIYLYIYIIIYIHPTVSCLALYGQLVAVLPWSVEWFDIQKKMLIIFLFALQASHHYCRVCSNCQQLDCLAACIQK